MIVRHLAIRNSQQPDQRFVIDVVRGPIEQPRQIIAQGALEARSKVEGFALLGAAPDDTVVLIGELDEKSGGRGVRVHYCQLAHALKPTEITRAPWTDATPDSWFPTFDVVPEPTAPADDEARRRPVNLSVRGAVKPLPNRGAQQDVALHLVNDSTSSNTVLHSARSRMASSVG